MKHVKLFEDFDDPIHPDIRDLFSLNSIIELSYGHFLEGPIESESDVRKIIDYIEDRAEETYYDALDAGYSEGWAHSARHDRYMDLLFRSEGQIKKLGYRIGMPEKDPE
jgi:hypothetical protein